jgi:hypothetical protein
LGRRRRRREKVARLIDNREKNSSSFATSVE